MSVSSFTPELSSTPSVCDLNETNLHQVITDILATGDISRSNQAYLARLMRSSEFLSPRDVALINRVFHRLQMGLLRVN
jgi:hypothetical protein